MMDLGKIVDKLLGEETKRRRFAIKIAEKIIKPAFERYISKIFPEDRKKAAYVSKERYSK